MPYHVNRLPCYAKSITLLSTLICHLYIASSSKLVLVPNYYAHVAKHENHYTNKGSSSINNDVGHHSIAFVYSLGAIRNDISS